jgi:hypothetical protein
MSETLGVKIITIIMVIGMTLTLSTGHLRIRLKFLTQALMMAFSSLRMWILFRLSLPL